MREKTNIVDFVEVKKNISEINSHLKKLVPYDEFDASIEKLNKYNDILNINKLSISEFNEKEKVINESISKLNQKLINLTTSINSDSLNLKNTLSDI